ncbi:type IX secretion system membrane protein PorP/SprF [Flavobacterium sp.]|jgi:type IX secretion system PorP/SprF family membrane protein|uniref:type IX secretion system membrane protein PorP/SprF n=1 Tax=Flavobacterium sp. TaxID=239 RepID=UPI0037BE9DD8
MKTKIIITSLLLVSLVSFSQQDSQYTQYMYNTININPAYAGSRGVLSVFGLHRSQWVGLDGAPVTNAITINSPIENTNLGVGLSFVNDRLGPTDQNNISADVSHTIKTSETYKLSFGVKGSIDLFSFDASKLNIYTADNTLQTYNNKFSPNIGAGIYFHSDKSYLGFSIPNFFETKRYSDSDYAVYKEKMNYYLIGGYVFDLNPNLKFKPAFMGKMVEGAPLQVDVSANFLFNDKFVLGAAWRWSAAASLMAGFQINEGLYIGYGYDLDTTKLAHYNSGTHEIFLRFELFNRQKRIISPRFF